jgi:uncharacterized protein
MHVRTRRTTSHDALRRAALISAPVLLLVTMTAAFLALVTLFGPRTGFWLAMAVYYLGWCIAFPLWAVGADELRASLREARSRASRPAWSGWLLLAIPVALAVAVGAREVWPQATPLVVAWTLPVALVNGTLEEVLWRGAFARAFPTSLVLGYLWPAIGFGFWHLAPLAADFGAYGASDVALVIGGGVLFGLCWGWVAYRTGSIRATVVSHVLVNLGLMSAAAFVG